MLNENKAIELNDEELEQVNGGYELKKIDGRYYKIFKAGDCFEYSGTKVKVKYDYQILCGYTQDIEVYVTLNPNATTAEYSIESNWIVFQEQYYVGNNVW